MSHHHIFHNTHLLPVHHAHSTDSSILLALQKQWERQERLDMERNQMEKQKEGRKRMKEEKEQRKEDRK